jgi:hypothetical protein
MQAKVTRIAAYSLAASATLALLIVLQSGTQLAVLRSAVAGKTEEEIEAAILAYLGIRVFVHWNDDGSLAIAVGGEPAVWPEDIVWD